MIHRLFPSQQPTQVPVLLPPCPGNLVTCTVGTPQDQRLEKIAARLLHPFAIKGKSYRAIKDTDLSALSHNGKRSFYKAAKISAWVTTISQSSHGDGVNKRNRDEIFSACRKWCEGDPAAPPASKKLRDNSHWVETAVSLATGTSNGV